MSPTIPSASTTAAKGIVSTVFIALVLDLLAFTLPLPLFPRLIAWYLQREAHSPSTLLARLLKLSYSWRGYLTALSGAAEQRTIAPEIRWGKAAADSLSQGKNWDVVLLGGAMGSLFSLCQCVISPWLGKYTAEREFCFAQCWEILFQQLFGYAQPPSWVFCSYSLNSTYLLSRLVGGLSEGNVQISTAIISDVTTPATRSRSLALIGIAFSVCFTIGPSIGAYFASRSLPNTAPSTDRWNVFALPAAISLGLLVVETLYLALKLPETRDWSEKQAEKGVSDAKPITSVVDSVEARLRKLRAMGRLHGLFLLFFSGAEFTLTFLTYDLFAASNAQNGRLLSYIGVLSALLQGRHVRPSMARLGEVRLATYGIFSCVLALGLLSTLPHPAVLSSYTASTIILYTAATFLSYTSATVVSCLTAAAAGCTTEGAGGDPRLQRGRALGGYRSKGQLGRAIGPILASSVYWVMGPRVCYAGLAGCLVVVWAASRGLVVEERRLKLGKTA